MKVGKYIVTTSAQERINSPGEFVGVAHLLWDEADCTCETSRTYHRGFKTQAEAQAHALEQIQIRVRDGVL